ncbi:MAG: hypothetical protein ACPHCI_01610 [Solirubrobacterales bacterium]
MKAFSGFMALFALSMLANAALGRWAFVPTETGTKWVILDIVIAILFAAVSYFAYVSAERAEFMRSIGTQEILRSEEERRSRLEETTEPTPEDRLDGT